MVNQYPIDAHFRNGRSITNSLNESLLRLRTPGREGFEYDFENDLAYISRKNIREGSNIKVKLYGGVRNGDVIEVFEENQYASLPVGDKVVIDIGASIADSSIYFALRGAQKVIALEPCPSTYQIAKKNIEENNISSKITLLLAGCGPNSGFITVNPNTKYKMTLETSNFGTVVPLLNLDAILQKFHVAPGAILKMDCEGVNTKFLTSVTRRA